MHLGDVFLGSMVSFLLTLVSIVVLVSTVSVLFFTRKRRKTKPEILIYTIIIAASLYGSTLFLPWLLIGKAGNMDYNEAQEKLLKTALMTTFNSKIKTEIYNTLTVNYQSRYDIKNEIYAYEQAIKYNKGYEGIAPLGGLRYNIIGDYDKAIADSQATNSYFQLVQTYMLLKDYPKALDNANKEVAKYPDFPLAYGRRANVYLHIPGNETNARKDYETALQKCKYKSQAETVKSMYNDKDYFEHDIQERRKNYGL